ncbi:MAG: hypothetical protein WDN76_05915 [Alphaproteobacteria bacterium]
MARSSRRFDQHDVQAQRHKKNYRLLGRASVWMIAIGALYSAMWMAFDFAWAEQFSPLVLFGAVAALVIQATLWLRESKNHWLRARFAAEQIRSINFQAFHLAAQAKDAADLADLVGTYTRRRLEELARKLNTRLAALREFSPEESLQLEAREGSPANAELYEQARALYRVKRVDYQIDFARDEAEILESSRRPHQAVADYFYITGALLVVMSIGMRVSELWLRNAESLSRFAPFVEFATMAVFIVGATLAILEHASIAEASVSRYRNYAFDLENMRTEVKLSGGGLYEEIVRTERLALRELKDFCEQALLISYRI